MGMKTITLAKERLLNEDHKLGGTAVAVYFYLADCCNEKTGQCNPSQETIAKIVGVSDRAIRDAIAKLVKHGFLLAESKAHKAAHGRGHKWTGSSQYTFLTGPEYRKPASSTDSDEYRKNSTGVPEDIARVPEEIDTSTGSRLPTNPKEPERTRIEPQREEGEIISGTKVYVYLKNCEVPDEYLLDISREVTDLINNRDDQIKDWRRYALKVAQSKLKELANQTTRDRSLEDDLTDKTWSDGLIH